MVAQRAPSTRVPCAQCSRTRGSSPEWVPDGALGGMLRVLAASWGFLGRLGAGSTPTAGVRVGEA